ncbi:MAG: AAA family ATPase [Gammaproteobacteria bacterium]|nr:AAA family ATPase [Gammaproteobacteria bacterium]
MPVRPLASTALYTFCPSENLDFDTTADLQALAEPIGQERAVEAIEFGLNIKGKGYNLFAAGPVGVGKHAFVRRYVEQKAATDPAPDDWCLVAHFADPRRPRALRLPPGRGVQFKQAMQGFSDEWVAVLTTALTADEYKQRLDGIQSPGWEQMQGACAQTVTAVVQPLVQTVQRKFSDLPEIVAHLDSLVEDIVDGVSALLVRCVERQKTEVVEILRCRAKRYQVNLLTADRGHHGAPVVNLVYPSRQNLLGSVDVAGNQTVDFNCYQAGALVRANGGYLIMDALQFMSQPSAWEALIRALRSESISPETDPPGPEAGGVRCLQPEPIPLDVKVILLGDREFYDVLSDNDDDFNALFKVVVDFEDRIDRVDANSGLYARFLAKLIEEDGLKPLHRDAVRRVIEHSARLAEDAEKLSTHVEVIGDVLREADYWATQAGDKLVAKVHVQQAIDAKVHRAERARLRTQEAMLRNILWVDTDGHKVGQVNGLSVLNHGNYAYGQAGRITARIKLGEGDVTDIEREVDLGGAIHSKGVLILTGYINGRYGQDRPLSLAASLVFEQSYGEVDGDSASAAELLALLSVLADLPVNQALAVTGSMDQFGQLQAIGGVNEKIEGFFDLCQARSLSGEQGVLIPAANICDLMLRQDVVDAVASGRFAVYAVSTVDEAVEILLGLPAGVRDGDGKYPPQTVNYRIEAKLDKFSHLHQAFSSSSGKSEDEESSGD